MKKLLLVAVGVSVVASVALAQGMMEQNNNGHMMNQKEQVQNNHMNNSEMMNHGKQGSQMNNSGNHMNNSKMMKHGN